MECTHVLLCPASDAWCQDKALTKGQGEGTGACTTLKKKTLYFERLWNLPMNMFFSLVFSHSNCEEHELQRDSGVYPFFLGNPTDTLSSRKLQSSGHSKIKRHSLNYHVLFSSAFGCAFCVFKQKHYFLGLQQCLWMSFFLPELDCNLFWAREISFFCVSAVPITLPVLNKWF